jgi:hypothetical protein
MLHCHGGLSAGLGPGRVELIASDRVTSTRKTGKSILTCSALVINDWRGLRLTERHRRHYLGRLEGRFGASLVGLINFGSFLVVLGIICAITPNIIRLVSNFFGDLHFRQIFPNVYFWVPSSTHPELYRAVFLFCVGWGIVQTVFLIARFAVRDWPEKITGSIASVFFFFGTAYLVNMLTLGLAVPVAISYFIMLVGFTILVRVTGYFL